MTTTLFAIGADLAALNDLLDETGGELVTPEAEAAWQSFAASLADAEAVKLDGYCGLIRTLEGEAAVAKAEAEQFSMKARARENRVKWLKERMKAHLEATGRAKVQTAAGRTVAIQANGGKAPLTLDPDPKWEKIGPDHKVIKYAYDTDGIRASLERGDVLDFAKMEPRGSHLRIR